MKNKRKIISIKANLMSKGEKKERGQVRSTITISLFTHRYRRVGVISTLWVTITAGVNFCQNFIDAVLVPVVIHKERVRQRAKSYPTLCWLYLEI
jgi:hypothetical protein